MRTIMQANKFWQRGVVFLSLATAAAACGVATPSPSNESQRQDAKSCRGITREEAHRSLLQSEQIESVTVLRERPFVARPSPLKVERAERGAKVSGARFVIRPAAGLTAERLALLARCDQQLVPSSASDSCPFEVEGASATAQSFGDAFALDIVSNDARVAEELVRRAEALRQPN